MRKSTNKSVSTRRTFTVDFKSPVLKLFRRLLSPIIQHNSLWIILTSEDKLISVMIRGWQDLDRRSPTWSYLGNLVAGLMISDEFGNRFFPTATTDYGQCPAGITCQRAVFSEAFCRLCYVLRSGINNQELNWVHVNFRKLDIRICLKSLQYATHRPTGVMCHSSTVFDMLASPLLQFRDTVHMGLLRILRFVFSHIVGSVSLLSTCFCWYL